MSEGSAQAGPPGGLLRELPEEEASGNTRRIYAEIRRLSGVPMVALIYRHLATIPGALEWAWAMLRPAMTAGLVQEQARELAGKAAVPVGPSLPRPALRIAGISAEDERAIASILDAYNRANPVNLLAVQYLACHLHEPGWDVADPRSFPSWDAPQALAPLPAMIDPQDMAAEVREIVMLLTDRSGPDTSRLWPSLYRHLAHWPNMLGFAAIIVTPVFPAIDAAAGRLREQFFLAAGELARWTVRPSAVRPSAVRPSDIAPPIAAPSDSDLEQLKSAIDSFSLRIPEMVVIGELLRRALPDRASGCRVSDGASGCMTSDGDGGR